LDFVAALGGPRPDARTAWSGAKPLKKGPGTPVVLVDADWDPPAKPLNGRLAAAAAGLLVALGGGAAWLGISSIPASPPSGEHAADRPPGRRRPTPAAGGARRLPAVRPRDRRGVGAAAPHHRHHARGALAA